MTKKRIMLLVGVGIILVALVGIAILANTKTEWVGTVETYGPLNLMENDSAISENKTSTYFLIDNKTDFKITGQILVSEGSVTLTYSMDDEVLAEVIYEPGIYEIESEVYSGKSGELCITYSATDDVQGTYDLFVNTRTSRLSKMIDRFKNIVE